ncbi:sortase family protein [Murinocardiopsis flavida]|uniref:Sortase family protein n=1 Tax=Murinocardiopsis flavida TaxID=645275 RepID=A0A2P8CV02_9ACTN|nr:class F sortase [Murinocardiopsis flavida]PSK88782.1 sortase family protein [Murinocardiopsis flavida]
MLKEHARAAGIRRRAWIGAAAFAAIAAGAVLLGYALLPREGAPMPPAAMAETIAPASAGEPPAPMGASPPTRIRIPSLDVRADVIPLGLNDDGTVAVPTLAQVADTSWYKNGPTPGERGSSVILGHVDSDTGPAVFFGVGGMDRGDEIAVDREDGSTAVFAVEAGETVPKDDFPTERVYGDLDYPGLRLVTCGGAFDKKSGSYADNIVLYARLVDART